MATDDKPTRSTSGDTYPKVAPISRDYSAVWRRYRRWDYAAGGAFFGGIGVSYALRQLAVPQWAGTAWGTVWFIAVAITATKSIFQYCPRCGRWIEIMIWGRFIWGCKKCGLRTCGAPNSRVPRPL